MSISQVPGGTSPRLSITNPNPNPIYHTCDLLSHPPPQANMDLMDGGGEAQMAPHTMPASYPHDRTRLQYELTVRQEPKQARMCGIGGKADRRPIDPPVIVQLRVIDPASAPPPPLQTTPPTPPPPPPHPLPPPLADDEPPYTNLAGYAQSFLQNPYYFMFASLAKPDDDTELHWLKDGRTRCTTGSVVSSLYALKDPTAAPAPPGGNASGGRPGGGCGLFRVSGFVGEDGGEL
ncbi:hypothetical protein B0H13DRAFT_2360713 [Mycena leptocephala]|nr:hypothetical protein B0H13DRAFT_2360713 [Mycena leptocephala]